MIAIKPTCRYQHGGLKLIPGDWSLLGSEKRPFTETELEIFKSVPSLGKTYSTPNNLNFAVQIFKCPVCGYVELHDPEDDA